MQAKVLSGSSKVESGRIYTYYRLSAVETLKGAPVSEPVLRVPGGVVGVVAYVVPGAPDFFTKEEGVFFLRGRAGGTFELDGITSGHYRIATDENGVPYVTPGPELAEPVLSAEGHLVPPGKPLPLADFKTLINHYLNRKADLPQFALLEGDAKPGAKLKAPGSQPQLSAGNVQAGFSRILDRPVDIFWDLSRDYGPVSGGQVKWYFNPDSIAGKSPYGVTPDQALEAVEQSFEHWNAVPTSAIKYTFAGSREDIHDNKLDLVNIITFSDSEYTYGIQKDAIASARPFALARRTWVGPEGLDYDLDGRIDFPDFPQGIWEAGTIIDCDIRWDASGPFADNDFAVDNTPGALSMQGVFNHELGHFAGLVHSPIRDLANLLKGGNRTPTMFSIAIPNAPDGSGNPMTSLEFDDLLSLSMLYPTPEFASQYGTLEGRVTNGIDGRPVRGNFVTALSLPEGQPYRSLNDAYDRAAVAAGVFTDQQGHFRIPGLPPGDYVLGLQPLDDEPVGTNRNAFNTLTSRFGDTDFIWDEFYNGDQEGADESDPFAYTPVSVAAGGVSSGIQFITNAYPKGRLSLRRLFGDRDFYVAANQLRTPFSAVSSTQDMVARKLPQVFEAPYKVVSAVCDFASNTAPPEGAQVVWPEIILAVGDSANLARPDLAHPLAVIRNFAGDGTLLSTDPLPFQYPVSVDRPGELWLLVRSPGNRFNAFHNLDVLGAGQDELQVDESFVSSDGGASFRSVKSFGISWRMGVVVEGTTGLTPLAGPHLAASELVPQSVALRLHFNAVKSLSGYPPEKTPRISLRHTFSAAPYPQASLLESAEQSDGAVSFNLSRIGRQADTTAYRVSGFRLDETGDQLTGEVALSGGVDQGAAGELSLSRLSGSGAGKYDGLWAGTVGSAGIKVQMDLVTQAGLPVGALIWPAEKAIPPDTALRFLGAPGDTLVELAGLPANPAGFELSAVDEDGRTSPFTVLGLGVDYHEPNQRLKDATPVFPAYSFPQTRHSLNSIRGIITATKDEDDIDYFRFPVAAGDSVVLDVDAVSQRPFDPASSLDAFIEAFDSTGARFRGTDGREVLSDDENGLDPFYTFVSPRDATCYLRLLDASVAYGDRGTRAGFNAFYELRLSILPRRGDVVRDRVIRIDDALAALALVSSPQGADPQAVYAADMNADGRVDLTDVGRVFQRALNDPLARPAALASAEGLSSGRALRFSLAVPVAGSWQVRVGQGREALESFMLEFRVSCPVEAAVAAELSQVLRLASRREGERLIVLGSLAAEAGPLFGPEGALLDLNAAPGVSITLVEAYAGATNGSLATVIGGAPLQNARLPKAFSLSENIPNPFNPSTAISYTVPEAEAGRLRQITLEVFDLRGRRVKILAEGPHEPGSYTVVWEGKDQSGRQLASGVYFYRLRAEGFSSTRKMVLLK